MRRPSKEQFKQIQSSVMRAQIRIVIQTAGGFAMEQRLLTKALNFLPDNLRPLLQEYWNSWGIRKTFFWYTIPFRDIEIECASAEKKIVKQCKPSKRKALRSSLRQEGPQRIFKDLRPQFENLKYEYMTELTLRGLRLFGKGGEISRTAFFESGRFYKKAFLTAIARNDLRFFERVGRVLRKPALKIRSIPLEPTSKLQKFLIDYWVSDSKDVPDLYRLSIAELTSVCRKHLHPQLTESAVEKARQRLELIPFRRMTRNTRL
jgi:hypothetical protein